MNGLWSAMGLLTNIPVPQRQSTSWTLFWFPLVGALMALMLSAAAWLSTRVSPPMVGAALLLTFGVWLNGALHLDGVADTADGLSASRAGVERAVAAMRDSRIGAHGSVAVTLLLLAKFVALWQLLAAGRGSIWLAVGMVTCMASSRFWVAQFVLLFAPARSDGMLASLRTSIKPFPTVCGALWLGGVVGLTAYANVRWSAWSAATCLAVGALGWILCRRWCKALGGSSGDVCGAVLETCETVGLVLWGLND